MVGLNCTRFAAWMLCAGLAGCATYHVQEGNWFHPGALAIEPAALARLALPSGFVADPVEVAAADGTLLRGLHVHAPGRRSTVFYLGGDNFMVARQGLDMSAGLAQQGVDVFMLDYRGYGGSQGTPSIHALMADAEAGLNYLRRKGAAAVVVHGMSMGSFVAAELAVRQPVEGLVLESTATSVRDWADHQVPWYGKPLVHVELAAALESQDNQQRLARYAGPLLLLAGGRDQKTPATMARALLRGSATNAACRELVVVPEAGHGDLLRYLPSQAAYRRLLDRIGAQCGLSHDRAAPAAPVASSAR